MEAIIIYIVKVNIAFGILYGIYKLAFTRDTFFSLRRFVLLGICVISITYPFVELSTLRSSTVDANILFNVYDVLLPEVLVGNGNGNVTNANTTWFWRNILIYISMLGMGLLLVRSLMEIRNLYKTRSKSNRQKINGISVYITEKETEPFSFLQWIFLSPHIFTDSELSEVLVHEHTHVREWHSLDIIFIQLIIIFNWFNPFVWLLRSEIRINHEYLADRNVVFLGNNKKSYQYHLIGLTANPRMAAANLYNNFSVLPLKNRLKMLNKKETPNIMIIKYLMFVPAFLLLLVLSNCAKTANSDKEKQFESELDELMVVGNGIEGVEPLEIPEVDFDLSGKVYDTPDVLAEFPGGGAALMKYLSKNVKYPVEAQEEGAQGRVILRMIVEKDGSISKVEVLKSVHEMLDEEAIRVIKLMPKWTPGQHKGKPVRVGYVFPITFTLQ